MGRAHLPDGGASSLVRVAEERGSFPLPGPIDLALTLRRARHGSYDPTARIAPTEAWRATRTREGPATQRLTIERDHLVVTAWGPGARLAVESAPALVGFTDEPEALQPRHRIVGELKRRLPGLRIGRTGAVVEALVPAVIEQKVTGLEAWRAFAALVRAHGEPAPGPGGLLLPPAPSVAARLPYHAFHRLGLERRRAETLLRVYTHAERLEEVVEMSSADAARRLTAISGIGPWTAGEVLQAALGDADAVSIGDYHTPSLVSSTLAGEPRADDARMLELLEPYRGHRGRVVRLLEAGTPWGSRRAPRSPARSIAEI